MNITDTDTGATGRSGRPTTPVEDAEDRLTNWLAELDGAVGHLEQRLHRILHQSLVGSDNQDCVPPSHGVPLVDSLSAYADQLGDHVQRLKTIIDRIAL